MLRIKVYTDGACKNNGKPTAKAGIGIYFDEDDKRNVSKPLEGMIQTNNRAELSAIYTALQILLKTEDIITDEFKVYSDSKYSIDCVTKWIHGWKEKGWKTSSNEPVKNKDLIEGIYNCIGKFRDLEFVYIKAHTTNMDEDSIGNRWADKFATSGAL
jgi:ribonuclease HI